MRHRTASLLFAANALGALLSACAPTVAFAQADPEPAIHASGQPTEPTFGTEPIALVHVVSTEIGIDLRIVWRETVTAAGVVLVGRAGGAQVASQARPSSIDMAMAYDRGEADRVRELLLAARPDPFSLPPLPERRPSGEADTRARLLLSRLKTSHQPITIAASRYAKTTGRVSGASTGC